jgi:hypothetical protein
MRHAVGVYALLCFGLHNEFFDLAGSGNETRFLNPGADRLKDEMTTYAGTLPA